MIFLTLNQFNNFLIFIFFGLIFGLIYNIFKIIFVIKKIDKIKKNIFNFLKNTIFFTIFYSIFTIIFVFLLNFYNYGNFSLALLFALFLGKIWFDSISKNLVVFLQNKWYNFIKVEIIEKHKHKS